MSPVRTARFEFVFIAVALSLNLLLATAARVESERMKRRRKVLLFGSLLLFPPLQMEPVTPLPLEQPLLMYFMSPLLFHIPEKSV